MKQLYLAAAVVVLTSACSNTPTAPTAAPVADAVPAPGLITIQYAINIPDRTVMQAFLTEFPNGVMMAPTAAQALYNYTGVYHMPNVYAGATAPPTAATTASGLAGLVVAPLSVASLDRFPASAWPDEYGGFPANTQVQWLGRFTYTQPR